MLPNLTTEQRLENLELAKQSRHERAQVKQNIRTGNVRLSLMLQAVAKAKSDPLCGALPIAPSVARMHCAEALRCVPGVGETKAAAIMAAAEIPVRRRIGGLTESKAAHLAELVREHEQRSA